MSQKSRTQNAKVECAFKIPDNFEAVLVGFVGSDCPVMCHVDQTHAFKAEKLPIIKTSELAFDNGTHRACFADEVGPIVHGWER
jgi:hypothetical protein